MIKPVDAMIPAFVEAGATSITFHVDASDDVDKTFRLIFEAGCQVGLAFNPDSPLSLLPGWIERMDSLLLMSVQPGFGGQRFLPRVLEKIKAAAAFVKTSRLPCRIAVDGGVTLENIEAILAAGADTFVLGTTLFSSKDYRETVKRCRAFFSSD